MNRHAGTKNQAPDNPLAVSDQLNVKSMDPIQLRSVTLRRFAEWQLIPNLHLPLLEPVADLQPKSASEIASRAITAIYAAKASFGAPRDRVKKDLHRFGLWIHLSADEQSFIEDEHASAESTHFHGWLIESIQFIAWALGLTALDHFEECQVTLAGLFPEAGTDPNLFISGAKLRPLEELLQEADTLYMLHWYAVAGSIAGRRDERVVPPRIIFRRHAADWLIGVAEKWEDVSLDT